MDHLTERAPTMADVAELAGLSVPTVSRALRDHPDVSLETRRRTQEAAASLGYRASATARALRTGRHQAISFVVPIGIIGWWEPLLHGAAQEATDAGFSLLLNPVSFEVGRNLTDSDAPGSVSSFFQESQHLPVDGFVVVTPMGERWKELGAARSKPVMIIDDLREHPGYHVWSSDSYDGARRAVEHLLAKGRRDVVALVPELESETLMSRERLRGYTDAVIAAGLEPRIVLSDETYPTSREFCSAVDELIAAGDPFDGIFALADYATFSAFRSLRKGGRRVPEDVAVVGFDDDPAAAALDPTLTTMAQPLPGFGAAAVRMLIRLLEGDEVPPTRHQLPTTLIERRSS